MNHSNHTTATAHPRSKPLSGVLAFLCASALALGLSACNKAPEVAAAPVPTTTMGTDLDDSVITTSVKSALLADASVKSFEISVETRKGDVLLSGFVDSQAQIVQATTVAQSVAGVKGVQNKLALKGADTTVGVELDDGIITGKVKAALLADANVKSFDIAVVTRKDEVQLSGFVNSEAQIERAVALARQVSGVRTVDNALKIKK